MEHLSKEQNATLKKIALVYSVKGVKFFNGMDGQGLNCILYKNNIKVSYIIDSGNGGEINWDNREEQKHLDTYLKKQVGSYNLEMIKGKSFDIDFDANLFIDYLVEQFEITKLYKRKCKKHTLVKTEDCNDTQYVEWKFPYNDSLKTHLKKYYGEKNIKYEIINERFI